MNVSAPQDTTGGGSFSFDVGTSPNYILVAISGRKRYAIASAVTVGGLAMVLLGRSSGWDTASEYWGLADPGLSGSQAFVVTAGGYESRSLVYSGQVNGSPSFAGFASDGGVADPCSLALDSGIDLAIGFSVCATRAWGSGLTPVGGCTKDGYWDHTDSYSVGWGGAFTRQTVYPTSGSRTVGVTFSGISATSGILLLAGDLEVEPDPVGMEMGFKTGTIALSGTPQLGRTRMRPFVLGFNPGRLGSAAKRQVSLVGGSIETPEMTVDGAEGDLLVQHIDRPPTWEGPDDHVHARRWVPAVYRPDPVGSPNDWRLLHADDGSVVMTWTED